MFRWMLLAALCTVIFGHIEESWAQTNGNFEGGFTAGVANGWSGWGTGTGTGFHKSSGTSGRIGGGIYGSLNNPAQAVLALNGKTTLVMDAGLGYLPQLKSQMPDTIFVGRLFINDPQSYVNDPVNKGIEFANICAAQSNQPTVWTSLCEPGTGTTTEMDNIAAFELSFTNRLHQLGMQSCVLNFGVGHPGDPTHMERQSVRDLLAVADYVGYHTYGSASEQLMGGPNGNGVDWEWYALRWRKYRAVYDANGWRMPPVIYTECTTWDGWKGRFSADTVLNDLKWMRARMLDDPWSLGMCIFLTGDNGGWSTFECANEPAIYNGGGADNAAFPADARSGRAQIFGNSTGTWTGGIVQSVQTVPGRQYRFRINYKWEYLEGVFPSVSLRLGHDASGQTASGTAGSIIWTVNLNTGVQAIHEVWRTAEVTFAASSANTSFWIEGSQPSASPKWRFCVDDVTVTDLTGGPTPTPPQAATATPTNTPPAAFTPTPTIPAPATNTPAATSTPFTGSNMLDNPGFEQSNGASHPFWTNNTLFGTNGTFPHPGTAQEGVKWASVSYGQGGTDAHELYQSVSVIPGHTYRLSVRAMLGGIDGTTTASLRWADGSYTGGGGSVIASHVWTHPQVPTAWIELTNTVTPASNTMAFILRAEFQGWGSGVNFDNCVLFDLAGPSATKTPTLAATSTPTRTATPTFTQPPPSTATRTPTATFTSPPASTATRTPTSVPSGTSTPTPTAPPSVTLRLNPPSVTLFHPPSSSSTPANQGTIDLDIEGAQNLGAFQADVLYAGNALEIAQPSDVAMGSFIGSTGNTVVPVGPAIDNIAGKVTYGASTLGGNPGPNGNGNLAKITWSTRFVSGRTVVPLVLQNVLVTDVPGNPQAASTVDGEIILCYFADMDCDNDVDIVDVQQTSSRWNTAVGHPSYNRRYDVDGDGDIDIADVQQVAGKWNRTAPFAP